MNRPFPLKAVLRVREQKEQVEEAALAAVHADLQEVRLAITRLQQETVQFETVRQQLTREVLHAAHHQMLALQARSLHETSALLKLRLQSLEAQRRVQQGRLLLARQDREALTELQQRHRRDAEEAARRAEGKQTDDLFSARCGRALAEAKRSAAAQNA